MTDVEDTRPLPQAPARPPLPGGTAPDPLPGPAAPAPGEPFPLAWAQHGAWWAQQRAEPPAWLVLSVRLPVPEGASVADVSRALAIVRDRHEILRTTFPVDEHGDPVQVVHPGGHLPVASADSEPAAWRKITRTGFDPEREPPIRAALHMAEGRPAHLCVLLHHLAVDEYGKAAFARELEAVLDGVARGAPAGLGPVAHTPREQVRSELSADGRRRDEAALDHWRAIHLRQLHDLPPRGPGDDRGERCSLTMRSADLPRLCRDIARRERCLPAAVLIAALAVGFANRHGRDRALLSMLVANRSAPDRLDAVCTWVQQGWLLVEVGADRPFRDVVREAADALRRCLRHGRYDVGAFYMWKLARGATDAVYDVPLLNFITAADGHDGDCGPGADVVHRRVERGRGANDIRVVTHPCHMTVHLTANDDLLTAAEGEELLRGLPVLLRQAAEDRDVPRTRLAGVPPRWVPGPGWADVDGRWTHLPDLEGALGRCPGVRAARVFHGDWRGRGAELLACVAADPGVTPAALRYALRTRRGAARLAPPHWYVVRGAPPGDPSCPAGWLAAGVRAQGAGDEPHPADPRDAAERALLEAFAALHPAGARDLTRSYAEAGGRYLRIPALVRRLAREGYRGPAPEDFVTTAPLRELARGMERR
ncbi:condensation domain-containing protein [Streptomyces capparidis]